MTLNAIKSSSNGPSYIASSDANSPAGVSPEIQPTQTEAAQDNAINMSRDELSKVTEEMNKSMQYLNVGIKFLLHEKTQTLMVQIVDVTDNTVLKEFPPHEMLDTKAKIREYIGILLDKKA